MMSLLMFILFLIFLILKMPISISMGLSALCIFIISGEDLRHLPQIVIMGIDSYPLMAVPFFILAGNIMNSTGITNRIFHFCKVAVSHLPGGLAQVIIFAECILSGVTGTAVGDCAALGTIGIKMMHDAGYRKSFSAAVCIAAATLGPIIPPSLMMVIYAIEANVSVGRLFLGGLLPGAVLAISMMIYIAYLVKTGKEKCPRTGRPSLNDLIKALKISFFAIFSPIIILLSFITGVVTPTEAGVIATFYSIVVGIGYREFSLKKIPKVLEESLILTSLVLFLIATATAMGHIMTVEQIPLKLSKFLLNLTTNQYFLLFLINLFLILLGSILEGMPILIIMTPILVPLVQSINMDLIHFGVVITLAITIGIMTPPMAIGIFILVGIAECSFEEISKEVIKFLVPIIIALFIISYFPKITLFLPNLLIP